MLEMYFTGDTSKSIPSVIGKKNAGYLSGATSPCFAFKEILIDLLRPILSEQKQETSKLATLFLLPKAELTGSVSFIIDVGLTFRIRRLTTSNDC